MDVVTFCQALECCGVTQQAAREAITAQDYTSMQEFAQLAEADIKNFVKEVNKLPAVSDPLMRITIPFASIKNSRQCITGT